MREFTLLIIFSVSLLSCSSATNQEVWKAEVAQVEADFNQMVAEEGMEKAFIFYAANDAVLNRNGLIISGKEEIATYFASQPHKETQLSWSPEYIEVASSGDLAYTYGNYSFSGTDSTGQTIKAQGIFHTVWKRQRDGSWKYVYD